MAALGFEALASTSLGLANMLGRPDSQVSRTEVIENCRAIVDATDLPVNVDLENGFAHAPQEAAEAIRLAAEAGAAGGSIEDATGDPRIRSTTSISRWRASGRRSRSPAPSRCRSC